MDKSGNHCFILCADSVFYSNFFSDKLQQIDLTVDGREVQARSFTCIDLVYITPDDSSAFELVLGRADGSIWHGCYEVTSTAAMDYAVEAFEPLVEVIPGEALSFKSVMDVKIVKHEPSAARPGSSLKRQNVNSVFVVTRSALY